MKSKKNKLIFMFLFLIVFFGIIFLIYLKCENKNNIKTTNTRIINNKDKKEEYNNSNNNNNETKKTIYTTATSVKPKEEQK